MTTKEINGAIHTKEIDYLNADFKAKINHGLIRRVDREIIEQRIMSVTDKEKLNKQLIKQQPFDALWAPLLF